MRSPFEQVLDYLDQKDVSEIVVGVGRALAYRRDGELTALTSAVLTRAQFLALVQPTPIFALIPDRDATTEQVEIELGGRRVRVWIGRRGDEIVARIAAAEGAPVAARPAPASPTRPAASPARPPSEPRVAFVSRPAAATPARATPAVPRATPEPLRPAPAPAPAVSAPAPAPAVSAPAPAPPARPSTFAELIARAHARRASDLLIAGDRAVSVRVLGELVALDPAAPALRPAEAEALLVPLLSDAQRAQLAELGYIDLALAAPDGGRLRCNISRQQGGLKGAFRLARAAPGTLDELGLPQALAKVIAHHQGLVVIAGPSGHGKTTTLAALVDLINRARPFHIVTVEDPIEIVHPRKAAVISQREIGASTRSFAAALKGSLRQDPDVIVIGELRDRETVEIALTASETGHLVIATMSTPSAAKTIDRLVDMFPPEDQSQVRASVAGALRAVVAQRLLPNAHGDGVVPAIELVTGVLPLAAMIRDDKLYQLPNLMQRGRAHGMIRFDDSLAELARAGRITTDVALRFAENRKELAPKLGAPAGKVPP